MYDLCKWFAGEMRPDSLRPEQKLYLGVNFETKKIVKFPFHFKSDVPYLPKKDSKSARLASMNGRQRPSSDVLT